jgi:hypothetical protein
MVGIMREIRNSINREEKHRVGERCRKQTSVGNQSLLEVDQGNSKRNVKYRETNQQN